MNDSPLLDLIPTEREAELLGMFSDYQTQFGRLPSLRCAARLIGVTHGTIQNRVARLTRLGYLQREALGAFTLTMTRGIRVVGEVR